MATLSAGVLTAHVRARGHAIDAIDLTLERPLQVLAGLRGKAPADCLRLLPLLFPLCGTAHALAALQAIEAATSMSPGPGHQVARDMLALADQCAAQAWRSCIDWTQLAGMPAQPARVAQARQRVGRIALALYPEGDCLHVGGGRLAPNAAALAAFRDELQGLREDMDRTDTPACLRAPMAHAMRAVEPEWTARIERRFAAMAATEAASLEALASQLESSAALPVAPRTSTEPTVQNGHGEGMALTARGELRYQFEIDAGTIAACRMSAPTDRAFAAGGEVAQRLRSLRQAADPLLAVRWALAAYDPCIDVRVVAAEA